MNIIRDIFHAIAKRAPITHKNANINTSPMNNIIRIITSIAFIINLVKKS